MRKNTKINSEEAYKVPNLEKGIAILELLSLSPGGLTLLEIKNATDISQTSAYRILNTLVRLNYLHWEEASKKYHLSRKMLTIGFRTLEEHDLLETVLPHMRNLRDEVKETVFFGVLGMDRGIFIEQAQGLYPFKFLLTPGNPFELHSSAPGKALLAFLSDAQREHYLDRMTFEKFTPNTIVSREAYLQELEKVRQCGYALDMEEGLRGVVCIGAPIFKYDSEPCGTIWTSGPIDRFTEKTIALTTQKILETTRMISFEMGYSAN